MSFTLKQQIIFDLDDTLVYCNKYFELILNQFADMLTDWIGSHRITTGDIRSKQTEIDVAGVQKIGFASHHFPESLIDTYRYFCQEVEREQNAAEEDLLMQLGMSVYEQEIEPYPGMVDTLNLLQNQGHELFLYTGGEAVIQQRKIEQMRLADYFDDRIFIRQHKNIEALEEILESRYFTRGQTWMIGNSLRTDIAPAMSAGINSIYIKHPDEWSFNIIELNQEHNIPMYTVASLVEVPRIIHNQMTAIQQGIASK
ncbi:dUMP phosphatase [compost metagenome]